MKSLKLTGLAFCASLTLSAVAAAQDITIAVAGPVTGSEAVSGRQMTDGAGLAVAGINAAGGVLGKRLRFTINDDACDPKQARSVAEKLAGARIAFVVGHFCSGSSIAASEVYADSNVLQITPASTATRVFATASSESLCACMPRTPSKRLANAGPPLASLSPSFCSTASRSFMQAA